MSATKHTLPFIGRTAIIDGLISRLQHPDDIRDNPTKFISPGFYGIAGAGKSRLLLEVELRGKLVTPYVAKIDFEPRSASSIPSNPLAFLRHLIDLLEEQDRVSRPGWRRVFWRWSNPFKQCREIVKQINVTTFNQNITLISSRVADISQVIDRENTIPDSLIQAFTTAITNLYAKREITRLFGYTGIKKRMPLVLVILDTVELAPRPIRQWLDQLYSITGAKNTLAFHFMFVIAGRFQLTGVLETPLPPFDESEAKSFVETYASFLLRHPTVKQQQTSGLDKLINSKTAQEQLVSRAQGIPLVLQLLVDTFALGTDIQIESLPEKQDVLVRFVIENYLDRLKEQAGRQNDDQLWMHYYLLLCSAVPRLIPNSAFLRSLLQGLPGTTFDTQSNYDELYRELSHEGFVQRSDDGELIMHSLIREGTFSYLQTGDAERFRELHQRAEKWFHANSDLPNYFYHRLHTDSAGAVAELKTAISGALAEQRWLDVQPLIEISVAVPLDKVEQAWIDLYKADLAWGETNRILALDRLRKLYELETTDLDQEIAARLEVWLGLTGVESELSTGGSPDIPDEYLADLLVWAEKRNLPHSKTYALLKLGENEFKLKNFEHAKDLIQRSMEIATQTKDEQTRALAMRLLGEIALIIGPLTDAHRWLRESSDLYESLGWQQPQAILHVLLAIALFSAGRVDEAKLLLDSALTVQDETQDLVHKAQTLRVLWLMAGLSPEMAAVPVANDALDESTRLWEETNDVLGQAQGLSLESEALLRMDSGDRFGEWYSTLRSVQKQATEKYNQTEDGIGKAGAYLMLGLIEAMDGSNPGRFDLAAINFKQARSFYRAERDLLSRAHCQVTLGAVSYVIGQRNPKALVESREALDEALNIYQELQDQRGVGAVLFIWGQIALLRLDYEKAQSHLEEARKPFASLADPTSCRVVSHIDELLQRVAQRSGPPDKHEKHIVFPFRARVIDLYGWSSILRREYESVYRIFHEDSPPIGFPAYNDFNNWISYEDEDSLKALAAWRVKWSKS